MSDISAAAVSSLRSRTGVSILQCKAALEEANGDEEQAIEILRKKGIASAAKKADREQKEGTVFTASSGNATALVVLHCETDFVARDDNFRSLGQEIADAVAKDGTEAATAIAEEKIPALVQKLGENISVGEMHRTESSISGSYVHSNGKIGVAIGLSSKDEETARDIAMHAAAMSPLYISPEEVPAEDVEKEKEIWKEQLAGEGKPAEIIEKIMDGKEKKFREENALLKQDFVKDPSKKVEDLLDGGTIDAYIRVAVG